jgi:hypothetical protein
MTKDEKAELRERNFWESCAADDVMSVIKYGLRSEVWRGPLMEAHLHLVYHFAHEENDHIDFMIKHATWTKPGPDSIAGRIIARAKAAAATTEAL